MQFVRHILRRCLPEELARRDGQNVPPKAESRRCAIDFPGQVSPSEAKDVAVSGEAEERRGE